MKRNNLLVKWGMAVFVAAVFMSSCYEDKGNYDYADLNRITFDGILPVYQIGAGQPIVIRPVITQTVPANEADLEYCWLNLGSDNRKVIDTLHKEKWVDSVTLDKLKLGNNKVVLQVIDKKLDTKYTSPYFTIEVDNDIKNGFMLLLNNEGRTDLRFINYNPTFAGGPKMEIRQVSLDDLPELGAPIGIATYFDNYSPMPSGNERDANNKLITYYYAVTLVTETGIYKLNPHDHSYKETYSSKYFTIGDFTTVNLTGIGTPDEKPRTGAVAAFLRDDQDNIMYYRAGSLVANQIYVPWAVGVFCNRYKDAEGNFTRFTPAKCFASWSNFVMVIYDKDSRSFVFKAATDNFCQKFTAPDDKFKFSNNDASFEPIWMFMRNADIYIDGASRSTVFTVARNTSTGAIDLLLFVANLTTSPQKVMKLWPQTDDGRTLTGMDKAKHFAMNNMINNAYGQSTATAYRHLFYYGTDKEIYAYNLGDGTFKQVFTAPEGSTILDMKFIPFQSVGTNAFAHNFIVVTGGSGDNSTSVGIYTVTTQDGSLTLREFTNSEGTQQCKWDGLPDYVGIDWKAKSL